MKPEKIECSNLYLRQIAESDAPLITRWKNDPVVKINALHSTAEVTLENQRADILAAAASEGDLYYLIVRRDGDKPVGYVRVNVLDDSGRVAWLRFALGEERGRGHGSEALRGMVDCLFAAGFHRIECEVYEFNTASLRVLEKIGFRCEGVKRDAHFEGDQYHDVRCWGLLESDWGAVEA
jgi:RimJ/RimL family protein N-acetyltransferase